MSRIVRAVSICLVCTLSMSVALAQALYDFNLPRQALADSLLAIGRQTATSILFEPAAVENVTAPAVRGQLSAVDAVNHLLTGTGLVVEQAATNTLLVRPQARLSSTDKRRAVLLERSDPADDQPAGEQTVPANPPTRQDPEGQITGGPAEPNKLPLEEVTVTGSLIPQAKPDTVSPEITISSEEIEDEGFRNAYDALRTLPVSSGPVQDAQSTGGFTPGANSVSLFALDPSFTLTLLNGRPLADYPLPFNGSSDITDLANIPVGLIDHIDILTGAASSIYGSSAMAGVINIVLKEKVEGLSFTVRDGGYSQGGGQNQRAQLSGGFSRDRLDVVYGMEFTHQDQMLQSEAPEMSVLSHGEVNSRDFLVLASGAGYVDPGAATCSPLSNLYGGTLTYSYRPSQGYYCGSPSAGYNSIINADDQFNAMFSAKYHISDRMTAYTELLYSHSQPTYSGGLPAWSTSLVKGSVGGYIWDANTQQAVLLQRIFSPEEIGGWNGEDQHVYTHEFNGSVGVKGGIGDSGINYDVYFHLSQENTHYVSGSGNFIDERAAAYYLGPQLGVTASGYPIFAPDLARLYTPLTVAQYDSFTADRSEYSVSWTDDITAILNSRKLFTLPAGDVGAAVILQRGTDEVHAPPDPNAAAGEFDGVTERPNSAGSRSHYSLGSELRIPIVPMLTADVSGRYDHYDYSAGTGYGGNNAAGKFTYKAGLEFRPRDDLLVRASYATAFRTPDLFYLFEGPTSSYGSVTDWYQCRLAGYSTKNISQCPLAGQASPLIISSGSTGLKDVTAKSYTTGFVWSPLENRLRLSVDYSRVDISNEVQQINLDTLLQTEADCRIGSSEAGQPYNINSPTCQNALALVQRGASGITQITSVPINIALEHEAGIQSEARYSWPTRLLGRFSVDARYFRQLQHTTKNFPGDAPLNLLCCNNNDEFFNTLSLDFVWKIGKSATTLHGTRYAPTWNDAGTARDLGPWVVINGSERYAVARGMFLELIVNNIFNRQPPYDPTNGSYPYYDTGSYNGYGRAYWVEFGAKFGGKGP